MNTLEYTTPSLPNGMYYWRARAKDAIGEWGNWSSEAPFTIDVP